MMMVLALRVKYKFRYRYRSMLSVKVNFLSPPFLDYNSESYKGWPGPGGPAARYKRWRHEIYADLRVQEKIVKHLEPEEDRNSVQMCPGNTSSFAQ